MSGANIFSPGSRAARPVGDSPGAARWRDASFSAAVSCRHGNGLTTPMTPFSNESRAAIVAGAVGRAKPDGVLDAPRSRVAVGPGDVGPDGATGAGIREKIGFTVA